MTDNPYRTPDAGMVDAPRGLEYVGFWRRVGASILDSLLLIAIILPLGFLIYGGDYLDSNKILHGPADAVLSYVLPAVAILLFWHYRSATPGKIAIGAIIVDARTGGKPTLRQNVLRYIGYYAATLALGLGLLWVTWDKRKQGWHDKLAGTVVVRRSLGNQPQARFEPE